MSVNKMYDDKFFDVDPGKINEDGYFEGIDGSDVGWATDDYTHFAFLPPAPLAEQMVKGQ